MSAIITISTQIFILILLGILCRSVGILEQNGRDQISRLVFNIALPCLLFTTAVETDLAAISGKAALCFAAGVLVPLPAYAIGQIAAVLGRTNGTQRQVIRVGAALSNTAFIGIPICTLLWGPQAGLLASLYDQGINLPIFILGPAGYAAKPDLKSIRRALLNPMILSMLTGFLFNMLHLQLPELFMTPLKITGNMTTPLALILIGSLLDFSRIRPFALKPLLLLSTSRLLVVPLFIFTLAIVLQFEPILSQVIIMQAAMPTSVLATLMAFEYRSDETLAVQGNILTVLASPLTLAFFAALIRWQF